MKLEVTRSNDGARLVFERDGPLLASFVDERLFQIFVAGIARTPSASLLDHDSGHYIAGTIGELASEMDGNAAVANASPENRRKWDNWVAFCNSWGHP